MSKTTPGFERPNFTATPNTLIDHLLPVMSNAELRVTLVLIRLTTGWHLTKTAESLSIPALAQLAGLSDSSCKTGLSEGVKRGTLKKHAVRDELNRKTFRYSVQFKAENSSYFHEIERPKKEAVEAASDDAEAKSSSQNLTGLNIDRTEGSPGQNLTGFHEDSSGQNLTGSYKEETNSLEEKQKEREEAPSAPLSELPEDDLLESPEHPIEQGTEIDPQQDSGQANEGSSNVTGSDKVPGGAAAGRGETERYLRRTFSHPFVDRMLGEIQPFGVNRETDWFALPLDRVKELATEATNTHVQFGVKVQTRLKDLLDQEVQRAGLPPIPTASGTPAADDNDLDALLAGATLNGRRTR